MNAPIKKLTPTQEAPEMLDITHEAHLVMQAVKATEGKYGTSYISQLLQGNDRFGLRDETHRTLPFFASLKEVYGFRIRNIINYLVVQRYLSTRLGQYALLTLTEKGNESLLTAMPIEVDARALRNSEYDRRILDGVRELRKAAADEAGMQSYQIFKDAVLNAIVEHKPGSLDALKSLDGMTDKVADQLGGAITKLVLDVEAQRKAQYPAAQEVKALFNAGMKMDEIAAKRQIQPSTAQNYLEMLHRAGEIDLAAWVEENLDHQTLYKGAEYFTQVQNPRLRDAYEVLGLDYNTLRLCRLYVNDVQRKQEQLKYVA